MVEYILQNGRKGSLDKMKRVLVTGGAGFVGSHLCDRLIKEGNYVICLDNLFTGRKANIEHLLSNPNFEFVEHDIVEPFEAKVDQIYNLACPASPPFYQEDMVATAKICFFGALNMLELAKKNNARILQASTSEVYGRPERATRSLRKRARSGTERQRFLRPIHTSGIERRIRAT